VAFCDVLTHLLLSDEEELTEDAKGFVEEVMNSFPFTSTRRERYAYLQLPIRIFSTSIVCTFSKRDENI
jgi:hypothetical protein